MSPNMQCGIKVDNRLLLSNVCEPGKSRSRFRIVYSLRCNDVEKVLLIFPGKLVTGIRFWFKNICEHYIVYF